MQNDRMPILLHSNSCRSSSSRRRTGRHRLRPHDGAGRPPQVGSDRSPSRRCGATMDTVPIDGTIVIGEGERDEAPMLYIGEKVGHGARATGRSRRTSRRSTSRSIRSRARTSARPARRTPSPCSRRPSTGGLLHAPDLYMEKLVVGPSSKDAVEPRRAGRRQPEGDRAHASAARSTISSSSCSTARATRS